MRHDNNIIAVAAGDVRIVIAPARPPDRRKTSSLCHYILSVAPDGPPFIAK
jgi:hypothetical protein